MNRFILSLAVTPLLMPHVVLADEFSPKLVVMEESTEEEPPLENDFLDVSTAVMWESTQLAPVMPRLTEPAGSAWTGFVRGHCTSYVASKRKITFRGDARRWPTNAAAAGYTLSSQPVVGAVVVTNESRYGHVAYVERVNDDGTFFLSEMNVKGRFRVSTRTLSVHDPRIVTFIL